MTHRSRAIAAISAWLLVAAAPAFAAGKAPWENYADRIAASQEVGRLGDDLVGDSIALNDGGLTFSATDASLPGNAGPAVAVGRSYRVRDMKYRAVDGVFGDWDVEVPHISSNFLGAWVGTNGSQSRCTYGGPPPADASKGIMAWDFWNGLNISIPGVGGGSILKSNGNQPEGTTTVNHPFLTNDHIRIDCLSSIRNAQDGVSGQGFVATTPDGTKYYFDWMARHTEPSLRRGTKTVYTTDILGNQIPREYTIPVYRRLLLATRVVDRFGNVVTYTYTNGPNERTRLVSVRSGETGGVGGDGRLITLSYNSSGFVSSVADNTGRTWTYTYGNTPDGRKTLTRVDVPGGDAWTIALAPFTDAEIEYMTTVSWGERTCTTELSPQNAGAAAAPVGSLTHPSGAKGTFTLGIRTHGRANVPLFCANVTLGGAPNDPTDDVAHVPASYDSWSVLTKTITGSGLPTATWAYTYASPRRYNNPNGGMFGTPYVCPSGSTLDQCAAKRVCTPTSGCGLIATTLVAGPENRWTRYTYGAEYRTNEGQLLKVENGSGTGPSSTIVAGRPSNVLRDAVHTYETTTNGTCPIQWGDNLQFGIDYAECVTPKTKVVTWQQGVEFVWEQLARDAYTMSTRVKRYSRVGTTVRDSRTEQTTYKHDVPKWVIGLVTSERNEELGFVTARTDYDATSLLPVTSYWPYPATGTATAQQRMTYSASGVLATVRDGLNNTVTLSNWYRGVPGMVTYPDGKTQTAVIDNRGRITRVTDQNGFATNYAYDARGLLASIAHPTGDVVAWNATTLSFAKSTATEYGFPAGTWKRTVSTGTGHKTTWFDALWRPRMTREHDAADATGTQRFNAWVYDAAGRTQFVGYPRSTVASMASFTQGVDTEYDALDRVTATAQDSELGILTTTTEYLTDFVTRTTNPRLKQTLTRYQAFDDPSAAVPDLIDAPTGQRTEIRRNVLGMALWMRRNGTQGQTETATRYYVYDDALRLCKQTEPETGSTVVGYDAAGNVTWSAAGLSLATSNPAPADHAATCAAQRPTAFASGRRVDRTYDTMNRLTQLKFPDNTGNQTWTYTPDGLPATIVTSNNGLGELVNNAYTYNRRRMLATEVSAQPGAYSWTVEYGYNANGHLSTLKYPSLSTVSYAPNALGQPTQAGAFATGVKYYPNGAIREFHYGNGIRHQMLQNARQLPARSTDTGVLDMEYGFDENGNVLATADHLNSSRSRWMQYDDLDRLTAAGSASFGGDHWHRFTYDVLDNLRSWKLGAATAGGAPAKDFATYEYDTKNRLTRILGTGGQVRESFTWDVQGNLKTKTGTTWNFDYGNRNRGIANQEGFRYDGHGRRVSTWLPQQGRARFYMYAQSGQLLFEGSESQQKNMEHIHLGGSLIASIEYLHGGGGTQVRYKHTDALGTPVVMTDAAGNEIAGTRKVYEPFGHAMGAAVDGIGYTGHVMDPQSDLVYMQQRYFDPSVGRFLSTDPVAAETLTGSNFNRYSYAANNPYRFVDPDGRRSVCATQANCQIVQVRSAGPIGDTEGPEGSGAPEGGAGNGNPTPQPTSQPPQEEENTVTREGDSEGEQAISLVGPVDAIRAFMASEEATLEAQNSGLPGAHNGPQDAYRHCTWSCLMAQRIGTDQARLIGDNHEVWGASNPAENQMDLFNNRIGRELGSTTALTCPVACKVALYNNLRVLTPSGPQP